MFSYESREDFIHHYVCPVKSEKGKQYERGYFATDKSNGAWTEISAGTIENSFDYGPCRWDLNEGLKIHFEVVKTINSRLKMSLYWLKSNGCKKIPFARNRKLWNYSISYRESGHYLRLHELLKSGHEIAQSKNDWWNRFELSRSFS